VLCIDTSGSMSGAKIAAARDTLLSMTPLFGARDRVALVGFNHAATQLTPMASLSCAEAATAFRRAAMHVAASGGTDIRAAARLAARILDSRSAPNPAAQVLILSDGQDGGAHGLTHPPGAVWSTLGFGKDHDAELLSSLAARSRPAGTFTFVERTDLLDETLASFVGDATRCHTSDVRVTISPAPGTTILSARAPGEQERAADGSLIVHLGGARVDETRELLLELDVAPPATAAAAGAFAAFSVVVCGAAGSDASAGRVATPPLIVSFRADAAEDMAGREALAGARNREAVALTAAAVAAAARSGAGDPAAIAASAVAAARSLLVGGAAARSGAEAELAELERSSREDGRLLTARRAMATAHAGTAQRGLMSPTSGKGATSMRYRMQCSKSAAPPAPRP